MKVKRIYIILLMVILAIATLIIYNKIAKHNVYTDEFEKIVVYDGSSSVNSTYTIYNNGTIEFEYFNCGRTKNKTKQISQNELDKIRNLYSKYDVKSWKDAEPVKGNQKFVLDGKEYDVLATDGGSESTVVTTYKNGEKTTAKTGSGFNEFVKELKDMLDKISGINPYKV